MTHSQNDGWGGGAACGPSAEPGCMFMEVTARRGGYRWESPPQNHPISIAATAGMGMGTTLTRAAILRMIDSFLLQVYPVSSSFPTPRRRDARVLSLRSSRCWHSIHDWRRTRPGQDYG